jgi:hypothetical protein
MLTGFISPVASTDVDSVDDILATVVVCSANATTDVDSIITVAIANANNLFLIILFSSLNLDSP